MRGDRDLGDETDAALYAELGEEEFVGEESLPEPLELEEPFDETVGLEFAEAAHDVAPDPAALDGGGEIRRQGVELPPQLRQHEQRLPASVAGRFVGATLVAVVVVAAVVATTLAAVSAVVVVAVVGFIAAKAAAGDGGGGGGGGGGWWWERAVEGRARGRREVGARNAGAQRRRERGAREVEQREAAGCPACEVEVERRRLC